MFRTKYLDYAELTQQLAQWSRAHPDLVRVSSIAKTPEARDIPLLTIGRNPGEARPAVWVDGNMHATEVCGSSVALAIAEDVINIHAGVKKDGNADLPAHMADTIRESLFYVVPRISPDGAEAVLKSGRYVRSSPIDARLHKGHAYWEAHDFDGDRTIGFMRQVSDDASLVELADFPGVMLPRTPDPPRPYSTLYPKRPISTPHCPRTPH